MLPTTSLPIFFPNSPPLPFPLLSLLFPSISPSPRHFVARWRTVEECLEEVEWECENMREWKICVIGLIVQCIIKVQLFLYVCISVIVFLLLRQLICTHEYRPFLINLILICHII